MADKGGLRWLKRQMNVKLAINEINNSDTCLYNLSMLLCKLFVLACELFMSTLDTLFSLEWM